MKRIVLALIIAVSLVSCDGGLFSSKLNLTATVEGLDKDTASFYVNKMENNRPVVIDTVQVINGVFNYKEEMPEEDFRLFVYSENPRAGLFLFLGNDKVTVKASIEKINEPEVTGSKSYDLYAGLYKSFSDVQKELSSLYQEANQAYTSGDSLKLESLKEAMEVTRKKSVDVIYDFAANNPTTNLSPWALLNALPDFDYERNKAAFDKFDEKVKASTYGKDLNKKLEAEAALAVGAVAPDFTLNTLKGEEFKLSAQKGKYILIDFWASWCSPCRAENPNNVAMYQKYSADGFEIVAISVDRIEDKAKWLEAIEQDGLPYTQILDTLKVNEIYNVRSIPNTLLLDKEGVIIAKNLRGEELSKKLEEIFQH